MGDCALVANKTSGRLNLAIWRTSHDKLYFCLAQNGRARLVGEVVYAGAALKELWPLLVAGEIVHLGPSTSFGMGRDSLEL